jgi:hypothetical protein
MREQGVLGALPAPRIGLHFGEPIAMTALKRNPHFPNPSIE